MKRSYYYSVLRRHVQGGIQETCTRAVIDSLALFTGLGFINHPTMSAFLHSKELKMHKAAFFIGLHHWSISLAYFIGLFHWPISLAYFIGLFHWPISLAYFIGLFHWPTSLAYFIGLFPSTTGYIHIFHLCSFGPLF